MPSRRPAPLLTRIARAVISPLWSMALAGAALVCLVSGRRLTLGKRLTQAAVFAWGVALIGAAARYVSASRPVFTPSPVDHIDFPIGAADASPLPQPETSPPMLAPASHPSIQEIPSITLTNRQVGLLVAALTAAGTYFLGEGGLFTLPLVGCWLVSIVCGWRALSDPDALQGTAGSFKLRDRLRSWFFSPSACSRGREGWGVRGLLKARLNAHNAAFATILLVGVGALFYRLDSAPAGMLIDHAYNLFDLRAIRAGDFSIYFPANFGREPLYFYLTALVSLAVGVNWFALKLTCALLAIGLLIAVCWMGRQMEDRLTGLLAMAVGAVSIWVMIFGRSGFRAISGALASALLVAALWRALRGGTRGHYLLAGLLLGAGMYTYTGFRLMPLVFAAVFPFALLLTPRGERLRLLGHFAAAVALAALVFMPQFSYWQHFPDNFWQRVSFLSPKGDPTFSSLSFYLESLWLTLGMYAFTIDAAWFSHVPDWATMGPIDGWLVYAGIGVWLWRLARRRRPLDLMPPLLLVILILPGALSVGAPYEIPSALRAVTSMPLALLAAGMALAAFIRAASRRGWAKPAATVCVLILAAAAAVNLNAYFKDFVPLHDSQSLRERLTADLIRQYFDEGGSAEDVYLIWETPYVSAFAQVVSAELNLPRTLNWNSTHTVSSYTLDRCLTPTVTGKARLIINYDNIAFIERVGTWLDQCFPGRAGDVRVASGGSVPLQIIDIGPAAR